MSHTTPTEIGTVRVALAVLTYRRPADIQAVVPLLLTHAEEVNDDPATDYRVEVLVVDNDPEASATDLGRSYAGRGLRYAHEPEPGIAAARNRALDEAADADVLVFIDDDERPTAAWLRTLLDTRSQTGAAAVAGPVVSRFTGDLDPWIAAGGFFDRAHRHGIATGTDIPVAATNNLLLDLRVVRELALRFDPSLGLGGGEDSLFTRTLTERGGRLVWCAEAVVTEEVLASRMNRSYVVKRALGHGNVSSRLEIGAARRTPERLWLRATFATRGTARLLAGGARVLVGTVSGSQRHHARGARAAARGAGMLLGSVGWSFQEYRRPVRAAHPRTARVYEVVRTAHLERAHELAPATILYGGRRYDFDPDLAVGLDLVRCSTFGLACEIARRRLAVLEVNEPLMRSGLLRGTVAVTVARVMGRLRRRRTSVVSYAIENLDPFSGPRPAGIRSRLRRAVDRRLAAYVAGRLDRLAFGTDGAKDTYAEALGTTVTARTTVRPALPAPCGCPPAAKSPDRVVYLGALHDRKGIRELMSAWTQVVDAAPDARLTVVGAGALEDEVRAFVDADGTVELIVDPPRARIHEVLRDASVLVLLSKRTPTWREQVGLPIVEGLAHGCTVITTGETGLADWLATHGHTVLSREPSADAVADAIAIALTARTPAARVLADLPARDGRLEADRWLLLDAGPVTA